MLASSFTVTGTGVNLSFELTQQVSTGGVLPPAVSVMTQTLVISNLDSQEITFELLRHVDADLLWSGGASPWLDDSVGTATNGSPPPNTPLIFTLSPLL